LILSFNCHAFLFSLYTIHSDNLSNAADFSENSLSKAFNGSTCSCATSFPASLICFNTFFQGVHLASSHRFNWSIAFLYLMYSDISIESLLLAQLYILLIAEDSVLDIAVLEKSNHHLGEI
jgi:hypothetical protein